MRTLASFEVAHDAAASTTTTCAGLTLKNRAECGPSIAKTDRLTESDRRPR